MHDDGLLVTDIAGSLGPEFARGLERELRMEVAKEKVEYANRAARVAKVNQQLLPNEYIDGLGGKIASIDARTYFRWEQQNPGCWSDKGFFREFLRDNPEARTPGNTAWKRA